MCGHVEYLKCEDHLGRLRHPDLGFGGFGELGAGGLRVDALEFFQDLTKACHFLLGLAPQNFFQGLETILLDLNLALDVLFVYLQTALILQNFSLSLPQHASWYEGLSDKLFTEVVVMENSKV